MLHFVKPIPHQNSKSPNIPDDYFDKDSRKIMEIGRKHGVDLYYVVSNAIKQSIKDKKPVTELNRHERYLGDKFSKELMKDLTKAGYQTTEWTVDHKNGWFGTGNKILINNK